MPPPTLSRARIMWPRPCWNFCSVYMCVCVCVRADPSAIIHAQSLNAHRDPAARSAVEKFFAAERERESCTFSLSLFAFSISLRRSLPSSSLYTCTRFFLRSLQHPLSLSLFQSTILASITPRAFKRARERYFLYMCSPLLFVCSLWIREFCRVCSLAKCSMFRSAIYSRC